MLALLATGCSKSPNSAEANAQKAKLWKEQQLGKAVKYYREIVETYPDSPFAAQAKARLQEIGPVATPAPPPKP